MAARGPVRRWLLILLAPLILPLALFALVLAVPPSAPFPRGAIPQHAHERSRCNWACHNRGCHHQPALPAVLTGDAGLYGKTIRGLFRLGARLHPDRMRGYGAANLLVFCVLWPGLMYALWIIAWKQRIALRERASR